MARKECPRHFKLSDLNSQIKQLKDAYPYLQADPVIDFIGSGEFASLRLPQGTHGWAAFPRAHKVCAHYGTAASTVTRRLGALDRNMSRPDSIYRTGRNSQGLLELHRWQPFDIHVVPVALGPSEYADISVDERKESRWDYEYPLGLFEGLNILLTHPGRLMSEIDLGIIFAGDHLSGDSAPTIRATATRGFVIDSVSVGIADPGLAEATWCMPQ
jgi:hypothetical protein